VKRHWPILVLGCAILTSSLLLLYLGRGQTPVVDQWGYIYAYQGWEPGTLFSPHNGHLVVFPLVVEKIVSAGFGLESQLPFQLLTVALSATVASLLFALIRDAVGDLLALAAAILILFYGAGADVLVPSFQISNLIGLASGLAVLLALRRESLAGDIAACALLAISMASFSIGLAFAVGAAAALTLRPPGSRLRRVWVVLLPVLLYAAWDLWARKFGEQHIYVHNLKIIGSALVDQAGAALSGLTGLFTTPNGPKPDANVVPIRTTWGPVLVAGLAVLVAFRVRRRPMPGPNAIVAIVVLVAYFLLVGIALNQYRNTFDTRLVYLGSVLMLLVVAELLAPYRPSRAVLAGIGVAFVFSICANVAELGDSAQFWRAKSSANRAKLAAVEIAGPAAAGSVRVEPLPEPMAFTVDQFHELDADFGLPAYSEVELRESAPGARRIADEELARVLEIGPRAALRLKPFPASRRIDATRSSNGDAEQRGACVALAPRAGEEMAARLELPPGGLAYSSAGAPDSLRIGRFGDTPAVELPPRSGSIAIPIPADGNDVPWYASLRVSGWTLVCPADSLA
jgi:hypothetical protein